MQCYVLGQYLKHASTNPRQLFASQYVHDALAAEYGNRRHHIFASIADLVDDRVLAQARSV